MIRTGTYRNQDGDLVHVRSTMTGYVVTHADGRVETFARATTPGIPPRPMPRNNPFKAGRA